MLGESRHLQLSSRVLDSPVTGQLSNLLSRWVFLHTWGMPFPLQFELNRRSFLTCADCLWDLGSSRSRRGVLKVNLYLRQIDLNIPSPYTDCQHERYISRYRIETALTESATKEGQERKEYRSRNMLTNFFRRVDYLRMPFCTSCGVVFVLPLTPRYFTSW